LNGSRANSPRNPGDFWFVFFAPVTFLFVFLFFLLLLPEISWQSFSRKTMAEDPREIRVLLENAEKQKQKEQKEKVFLSDSDNQAQGNVTREQGFSAVTKDYVFDYKTSGRTGKDSLKNGSNYRTYVSSTGKYTVTLHPDSGNPTVKSSEVKITRRLPSYYNFKDRFALSWNKNGTPRIPTKNMEHYSYFRKMLSKIQDHWSPPGGNPLMMDANAFYGTTPTPGMVRYQAFPTQDIRVVFMLDAEGNVIDLRLHESKGFSALDASCLESIESSRNFGAVPTELLDNGTLIVPLIFRIILK